MNDSPGWASPGSTPSDGERPDGAAATPDGAAPAPDPAPAPDGGTGGTPPADQRWSAEQPPAGQWTGVNPGGPAPGPGGPAQGWGAPGSGWDPSSRGGAHTAWGAKPYAPKPGVIPLRPLGVGEILDGAVSTMRAHWRTVLSITLAVAVVTQLAITLVQGFALDDLNTAAAGDPEAALRQQLDAIGGSIAASAVAQVITLIGTILATATLTMVFSRAVLGRTSTVAEAWQEARPRLLKLTGLTLLLLLMVVAVFAVGLLPGILTGSWGLGLGGMLIAFPVALWLYIRFSLASPALMLEKQPVLKSLARSARLVRGAWWRIFLITLLTGIITSIVAGIIVFPFTIAGMIFGGDGFQGIIEGTATYSWGFLVITAIGSVIALTVTMPISAGVTVLLYIDQRIRREALDLELARAAGLQGPGGTPPGTAAAGG
ncbi:hypothetical protein ACIQUQ_24010 [Streptomyces sp. NPDC101118]|uniref:hypothetical protein n=1 Tax=Streptomyces sp. NPDC101118 TaxID=3366109 RepID=UPI00381B3A45